MLVNVVGGRSADSNQRIMYSTTCMANEFKMLNIMRRIMTSIEILKVLLKILGTSLKSRTQSSRLWYLNTYSDSLS